MNIEWIEHILGEEDSIFFTDPSDMDEFGEPWLTVLWFPTLTITILDGDQVSVKLGHHRPSLNHDWTTVQSKEDLRILIEECLGQAL